MTILDFIPTSAVNIIRTYAISEYVELAELFSATCQNADPDYPPSSLQYLRHYANRSFMALCSACPDQSQATLASALFSVIREEK